VKTGGLPVVVWDLRDTGPGNGSAFFVMVACNNSRCGKVNERLYRLSREGVKSGSANRDGIPLDPDQEVIPIQHQDFKRVRAGCDRRAAEHAGPLVDRHARG
jgi:hypothetical protein